MKGNPTFLLATDYSFNEMSPFHSMTESVKGKNSVISSPNTPDLNERFHPYPLCVFSNPCTWTWYGVGMELIWTKPGPLVIYRFTDAHHVCPYKYKDTRLYSIARMQSEYFLCVLKF